MGIALAAFAAAVISVGVHGQTPAAAPTGIITGVVQGANDVLLAPNLAEAAGPVTPVEGLVDHRGEPIGGVSQGYRGRPSMRSAR